MKLLPHDSFTLFSPLSLPVVLESLAKNVEAVTSYRPCHHAPYQGSISQTGFRINRVIRGRNSFIPIIRGRFEPHPHGTTIYIDMRPHTFVLSFLGVWFLIWYSAALPIALLAGSISPMSIGFLVIPILMLLIFHRAFWVEARRSRDELLQMVYGQLVTNQKQ